MHSDRAAQYVIQPRVMTSNDDTLYTILLKSFVSYCFPNISLHILHSVLYTFAGADKENLFNNQELL